MDKRLLEIIVCPVCKGPLKFDRLAGSKAQDGNTTTLKPTEGELICERDHLAFPIRDDIPVMLVDQARHTDPAA